MNNKIKYSQLVINHINSYQPSIAHYYREKAPTRRCLNPELSVSTLYRHYCENRPNFKVSLRYFQIIFKKQNIGFSRPSVDECVECLVYADHKKDNNNIKQNTVDRETIAQGGSNVEIDFEKETLEKQFERNNESIGLIIDSVHDVSNCEPCQSFRKHQETYRAEPIEYLKPVPEGVVCFAGDMQKVIVLPKLTTKEHFFVSRLVTFNQTFASKTPICPSYCILWHEEIFVRKVLDVTSAFFTVIKVSGCPKNIWFWLDSCSGQNKNWYFFTAIVQSLNTWCSSETISLTFLEKVHTFQAADSIHGDIGKIMKKTPIIGDFDAFANICEQSGKNTRAVLMDYDDIYQFRKMVCSQNKC